MDPRNLIGSLKAAILVHAMGWDAIGPVVDQLSKSERSLIFKLQSKLGEISPALVESVAREFLEKAAPPKQIESGKTSDADATGEDGTDPQRIKKLKAIQSIPPDLLIQLIQNEHPQTISLVVAHLEPHIASEVMAILPDELKADVAYRIANLDKVASGMLEEIENVFEEILATKETSATQKAGGVPRLAEILNMIESTSAEQIIEEIEEDDPELAEKIRQNMFVFDDLVLVDDRGLQKVLRSVESQELAVALKAATNEVKEKIFRNMSQRAAEILKEEMEVSGAVRIKDVTDAQQKITKIVQEMERKGEVVISGRGGEEFVG
ncbi:flagellar motor switch protein FliG [Desulfosarcina ovata subsp. sediminis]|uniref:Flagellar motor switch protein FliG n=1 Tax=Desulfosarcina ovata subsp. sediminis TaxID=885957 RepID=A0A5K7ZHQ4_9BACT|nr:flagellar motor switch protein FliG [Desulfosarcina ovata]BBO79795.1 flagellar motor switch protein FliG [Desulfosarcina ovata subsp. sediminis]